MSHRFGRTHRTPNTTKTRKTQEVLLGGRNTTGGCFLTHCVTGYYRRASTQRLVASSTANTALCSALSRISHVPVNSCASRPPSPCTATSTNFRSNASTSCAPSSAIELSGSHSSRHDAAPGVVSERVRLFRRFPPRFPREGSGALGGGGGGGGGVSAIGSSAEPFGAGLE